MRDHLFTEEHRKNLILNHRGTSGKHNTAESNQKRRLSFLGEKNPNFGKHFTSKLKGKTFEELYGIEKAKEIKKNMCKPKSEEAKANMKKAFNSEITKQRRRDARFKILASFKDTSIEVRLQNILRDNNIIFEKHKPIYGQPDLFIEPNICIFADGDYWHCNPKFYKVNYFHDVYKITAEQICKKDESITNRLVNRGYVVLRFWENEINNDLLNCYNRIKEFMLCN